MSTGGPIELNADGLIPELPNMALSHGPRQHAGRDDCPWEMLTLQLSVLDARRWQASSPA